SVVATPLQEGDQVRSALGVERFLLGSKDSAGLGAIPGKCCGDRAFIGARVRGQAVLVKAEGPQSAGRHEATDGHAHDLFKGWPMHPAPGGRQMVRLLAPRVVLVTEAPVQPGESPGHGSRPEAPFEETTDVDGRQEFFPRADEVVQANESDNAVEVSLEAPLLPELLEDGAGRLQIATELAEPGL